LILIWILTEKIETLARKKGVILLLIKPEFLSEYIKLRAMPVAEGAGPQSGRASLREDRASDLALKQSAKAAHPSWSIS
jgi:hypothetical protein